MTFASVRIIESAERAGDLLDVRSEGLGASERAAADLSDQGVR